MFALHHAELTDALSLITATKVDTAENRKPITLANSLSVMHSFRVLCILAYAKSVTSLAAVDA